MTQKSKSKKKRKTMEQKPVEKQEEKKVEQKQPVKKKVNKVGIEVYFSIAKIKKHHQAGMKMYKNAKDLMMPIEEWKVFFQNY